MKHALGYDEYLRGESRPARGAWIETLRHNKMQESKEVAPRTGRVD